MRAKIVSNTIQSPDSGSVSEAVVDAIGDRPEPEEWTISLHEPQNTTDYVIAITGPDFRWRRTFFAPYEQSPLYINDEVRKAVNGAQKATIIPLHYINLDLQNGEAFSILDSITVEKIDGLLNPAHFKLWDQQVSPRSVKSITSARFGLVHRFRSSHSIGRTENDSKDLLFKIFTCLRLLKPTRSEFAAVQVNLIENGAADVFSFTEPGQIPLSIPTSELLNHIDLNDLKRLASLIERFLLLLRTGPDPLLRAIRYFNVGYQGMHDSVIQLVTWVMAIESVFSTSDRVLPREELFNRAMRQYFGSYVARVGDLLPDVFELRDRFVHGLWIPEKFNAKLGHEMPGMNREPYADTLREAANYILRKSLLKAIQL
jgi:hypothetical protein